ncbi:MAG: HNH endonuclease [Alphaproteobacteria bacterium]|nr:HNH endonuclease [Alphaproteobacteria bacterium]
MTLNSLYTCDNLFLLSGMNSESVDLIYLDPPFNSKRTYSAPVGSKSAGASFTDMWGWDDVNIAYLERLYESHPDIVNFIDTIYSLHSKAMGAYITYMTQRLLEMRRILKSTGSIYVHIDPTASHYLKIIMDGIFGKSNFRNEIVWCYSIGGKSQRDFGKKHDIILRYSKTQNYYFDKKGASIPRKPNSHMKIGTDDNGLDYQEKKDKKSGKVYRYYLHEGKIADDYWVDIETLNREAKERMGYPTQKPLALLHRIIKASSEEGDVVFDPFCGCATACVASQQLNRKWIGCDIEEKAADILVERLSDDAGMFSDFVHTTIPPQRTDVERIEPTLPIKQRLYQQQDGHCNGCLTEYQIKDFEIDHIIPKSKGGGDYYENYQLLCGHCNRTKSNKPMDYLLAKVARITHIRKTVSYD